MLSYDGTTVFKKLDGIRNQYCSITTKPVYCSALASYTCQQDQLESINECLKAIGETPVAKKTGACTQVIKKKSYVCKIKDAAANVLLPYLGDTN